MEGRPHLNLTAGVSNQTERSERASDLKLAGATKEANADFFSKP